MKKRHERPAGFTLVELIVVVAILSVLAALVLSRFDTLLKDAGHAAAASSMADAGQAIEAWYTSNQMYPDGWDTRLNASGTLLTPAAGTTLGLPPELVGSTGRLTTYPLTAGDALGFANVGITTLFNYDGASGTAEVSEVSRLNDEFNTPVTIASGTNVAVINTAQANSSGSGTTNKIIDHIFSQNLIVGGTLGATPTVSQGSGSTATTVPAQLVAFGIGTHNMLVSGASSATGAVNPKKAFMREPPVDGSFNSALMYNRLIVVFVLTPSTSGATSASTVTFAGVFGADGDLITDDAAALNAAAQ